MKLLKIPLNAGALDKKKGIEKAPDRVCSFINDFFLTEQGAMPVFEISEANINNSHLEESHKSIYNEVLKLKDYSLLLGGDHSLTYPAFKAFAKNNPGAGIIVFDAHPDLQENHQPPTHEDYLRVLIEEEVVKPENVIIVGARNMSREERKFLIDKKIKNFSMREISFEGLREVSDSIMSVARQWPKTYLSIDIDVLDLAFAPGTGYQEPGGLTSRELIYLLQRLKLIKNIGMIDVVEVNPDKDINELTSRIAAKLIVEMS
jgi:arginase family enzyme